MIAVEMPIQLALHMPLRTRQVTVLSGMLSYAVSESCIGKHTNIGRILAMSREIQPKLVKHIERANLLSGEPPRGAGSGGRLRNREEAFGSPALSGYTPQRKKNALGKIAVEGFFSPGTIDAALDTMVEDLRRHNENLQVDLEVSQKRESDLSSKIQDLESRLKRDMIKLESAALRKAEEARADHEAEITRLRYQLEDLQDVKVREEVAQRELANVRDDMDLLAHTTEKLAETEEKFRKCRDRLEQLGDVKDALKREEEAHSASVEECLRLENELKTLQPLRRQLEGYKRRAIDAEVKLAECQEDLKRLTNISQNLTSAHKELLTGSKMQQEEADELRRRLYESESTQDDRTATLGEGISELNPKIKEELDRLRNENTQLKDFCAKREDDAVQMLEEKMDDLSRLSNKFKDQYFTTKGDLELTRKELESSRNQEAQLRVGVEEWTAKWTEVDRLLQQTNSSLDQLKVDLEETERLLEEAKAREVDLLGAVQQWQDKARVADCLAHRRGVELETTKKELDETLNSLLASQGRETQLNIDLDDWASKCSELQEKQSELQEVHASAQESLEEAQAELEEVMAREASLREEMAAMIGEKNLLEEQLEAERVSKECAISAANQILEQNREELEEKGKKDLSDLQEKMNTLLEQERQAYRKQLIKAATDFKELKFNSDAALEETKTELKAMLTSKKEQHQAQISTMKEQYEAAIESLKNQAIEDRDILIDKGKAMLRDTRSKAEAEINEIDDELTETKQVLSQLQKAHAEYQEKTQAKVASYKHKLLFASSRITELSGENDEMQETVKTIEREKFKVLEENDRFRRQLGGRYGADGKTQNQLETLRKEFNAILEENRELKKSGAKRGDKLASISENTFETNGPTPYSRGGVSGSTLSQLREEYEEQIQALNDEKRELVMRNSAAITDVQKAEQRSWDLEKQLAKIKDELTSTKLAVQRAERFVEENSVLHEESFHQDPDENNFKLLEEDAKMMSLDTMTLDPPAPLLSVLTPSSRANGKTILVDSSRLKLPKVETTLPKPNMKPKAAPLVTRNLPSLMDMTQVSESPDTQPDCKQS
jgi:chromosome segregation ATPase